MGRALSAEFGPCSVTYTTRHQASAHTHHPEGAGPRKKQDQGKTTWPGMRPSQKNKQKTPKTYRLGHFNRPLIGVYDRGTLLLLR